MNSLDGVSSRVASIYKEFYEDREALRAVNLYSIFEEMAAAVESASESYRLHMDYSLLGELVRSYFLDAIRYKEYHFNPEEENPKFIAALDKLGYENISQIDPLSQDWTTLVHSTANINKSKVASYTVKWILACKPITLINVSEIIEPALGSIFLSSINEYYALNCALFALGIEASKIEAKKLDELIYAFRFRKFDESAYFMIFTEDYLLSRVGQ